MAILTFILGLCIGLGIGLLRHYQRQKQIRNLLKLLPLAVNEESALPLMSRLRQAMTRLGQYQTQLDNTIAQLIYVLEQAPIGYLEIDHANNLLWCNSYSRELLKIDRWQPDRVRLLLELVRSYELDRLIEQTRSHQHPQTQEWVYQTTYLAVEETTQTRSPQPYSVHLHAWTIPLRNREVGVFLENRQPLMEAIKQRDRTFSDLAHELRTPLTSIHLVAETLFDRLPPPEKTWVEQMLKDTQRLMTLIQDCLEISHLENSSNQLERNEINLKSLIFSTWQTLDPLAQQKHLSLQYQEHNNPSDNPIMIVGDAERLIRVFLNLLDNSIKYSPPEQVIQITLTLNPPSSDVKESESWITIDIVDHGTGFREADLAYVFERLYRGDVSRQRNPETNPTATYPVGRGSGLGLSIAQQIVHAHGGTIHAQNSPKTGGAWLQIKLPFFH